MAPYLPPRIPNPKQDAERRARLISTAIAMLFWIAVALPVVFMLIAYGYSDQAPAALRRLTIAFDGLFGSPVWALIGPK